MPSSPPTPASPDPPIDLVGQHPTPLDSVAIRDLDWEEQTLVVSCASGNQYEATWGGVNLVDALERAGIPDDTTHVIVTAADGYQVCIDLRAAFDATIALTRDGTPIADIEAYHSRLVSPRIEGTRTTKGIVRIEPMALAPGTAPESVEVLEPTE